ncbi:hypothetical protein GCM10010523_23300 [Paenarthrobacter ilicis]
MDVAGAGGDVILLPLPRHSMGQHGVPVNEVHQRFIAEGAGESRAECWHPIKLVPSRGRLSGWFAGASVGLVLDDRLTRYAFPWLS